MKKVKFSCATTLLLLLGSFFLNHTTAQAQTPVFEHAVDYNDFVVGAQEKISINYQIVLLALQDKNTTLDQVLAMLAELIQVTDAAIAEVEAAQPYPSGEGFKAGALGLFRFYRKMYAETYPEMFELMFTESPTPAQEARISELYGDLQQSEPIYDAKYIEAQLEFARRNNFTIASPEAAPEK
ncbi:MAG: hypothetical protein H6581_06120 [Bacteroidia bacterium]|nr:hypothetical protein [Bacteroidia bacterium]